MHQLRRKIPANYGRETERINNALELLKNDGSLSEGLDLLESIGKSAPHSTAYFHLAKFWHNKKDYNKSNGYVQKYLQVKSNIRNVNARFLSGMNFEKSGDLNKAKIVYESILESGLEGIPAGVEKRLSKIEKILQIYELVMELDKAFKNSDLEKCKKLIIPLRSFDNDLMDMPWHNDVLLAEAAYFCFSSDIEKRLANYDPKLINKSVEFNYVGWPKRIQQLIRGKSVLDVGCGFGGYGMGFIIAGAELYTGLDPAMDLDSTAAKNKRTRTWGHLDSTPREIAAKSDYIKLVRGKSEELEFNKKFDVISLHNVTEHLFNIEDVFKGLSTRLKEDGVLVFMHHNYYFWNGHHMDPIKTDQLDINNSEHMTVADWNHVLNVNNFPEDHFINIDLNKIKINSLKSLTKKYFKITVWDSITSKDDVKSRLTPELMNKLLKHDNELTEYDLLTNAIYCEAKLK